MPLENLCTSRVGLLGRLARFLTAALATICLASGCAAHRSYTASTLPPVLEAPPVTNAQVLDLTDLTIPPTNSEQIHGGDVLEISIAAGLGREDVTTFPVRVTDSGVAMLPQIGDLPVAGLDLAGAEQAIAAACRHRNLYLDPRVTVMLKQQRVNRITVVGAVKKPGVYELPRGSSYLLGAIVQSGGLAEDAGTKVEIRRPSSPSALASAAPGYSQTGDVQLTAGAEPATTVARIDLAQLVRSGGIEEYLPDSTAVMIERRQPQPIEVLGLVKKPGQYELPSNQELRVLGAIALTGGLANPLANKIMVVRRDPSTNDVVLIKVSYEKAKRELAENVRLAPGDIVTVERTGATLLMDTLNFIRVSVGGNARIF